MIRILKLLAKSKLGRKLFFYFIDAYVESTSTQIDDNVKRLIEKMFSGEDFRPEVAYLTEQLYKKFGDIVEDHKG